MNTRVVVAMGLPPGKLAFPLLNVALNCITVCGLLAGTRKDRAEALAFAAGTKVRADIALQPLSPIKHLLYRLQLGDVASRVGLDFSNH